MKRRVVISVVLCLVLCGFSCAQGRLWKTLGNIASAVSGAVMDGYLQQSGYSANESREIISNVSSALGVNSSNVQKGIDFMDSDKKGRVNMAVDMALETTGELTGMQNVTSQIQKGVNAGFAVSNADNNYEKANIVTGATLDVVGDLTGGHSVTDKISAYVDANMTYLADVSKAETVADLQIAAGKKNQAYTDLIVDIGMELYDRKVAKEEAEMQERIERRKRESEMKNEGCNGEMNSNSTNKRRESNFGDGGRNGRGNDGVDSRQGVDEGQIVGEDTRPAERQEEYMNEAPNTLPHAMIDDRFPEEEKAAAIQLQHIVVDDYAVNEVVLSSPKCERLAEIAGLLKQNPELRVNLVVYTSLDEKSKTVGYERAREAREYLLMKMGIGSERVFVKEQNKFQTQSGKTDHPQRCIAITVFRRGESGEEIGEL